LCEWLPDLKDGASGSDVFCVVGRCGHVDRLTQASTDRDVPTARPEFQNAQTLDLQRGVYITVMLSVTGFTGPAAHLQVQFFELVPAARARLRGRRPAADLDQGLAGTPGLVADLRDQARPACIRDCSREPPVLEHGLDGQRLHNGET